MHYTDINHILVVMPQCFVEQEKQRADINEVRLVEPAWLWYFLWYKLEKRLRSEPGETEDQVLGQKCAARLGGRRGQIPSTQACICGAKWANFLRVQFRDGSYKCPIVYLGILPHILFLNKEYSFSIVEIMREKNLLYPCSSKLALVLLKSWSQSAQCKQYEQIVAEVECHH